MATRKPIIGITPTPVEDTSSGASVMRYTISKNYTEAVEAAGGVPMVIPIQDGNVDDIVSVIDGLILSGGGDIRPEIYGDTEYHEKTYGIHDGRDSLELALAKKAIDENIPTFCICRGVQILNVAMGGTMVQDIEGQYATDIQHRQQANDIPADQPAHKVTATPGSLLARTYGQEEIQVNSFHHQALKEIGQGLEIDGVSPDEIVEGVSYPDSNWVLGVQWHPEMMFRAQPEHLKPFQALVQQAAKRKAAAN